MFRFTSLYQCDTTTHSTPFLVTLPYYNIPYLYTYITGMEFGAHEMNLCG
jgi:hypothetical protein